MNKFLSFTLITGMLVLSRVAVAEPEVELIWTGTSGSGTPGSNTITAEQGDVLQLDILVNGDPLGFVSAMVSLSWAPNILSGYGAQECPSPPNLIPATCVDASEVTFMPTNGGIAESQGSATGFDAVSLPGAFGILVPGFYSETMHLGRVEFVVEAEANSDVVVEYEEVPEEIAAGVLDGNLVLHYPEASASIKPPVGC